ncbi:hypothetical protein BDZ97DRAFT_1796561 [Flammula alnicola]|nr:hypothetical protein BDZ97DRAFT_1796561 [Flammula alnicola]
MPDTLDISAVASALSTIPNTLHALLQKVSIPLSGVVLSTRTRFILSGAALAIVLKFLIGSKSTTKRYISDLDKVGKRVEVGVAGVKTREGNDGAEYDVIIIGGALRFSRTPAGFGRLLFNPKHVHGLRTEPQAAASDKQNFWPRAKMLGGCMAQYGAFGDFDQWAAYMNDDSWAWKNISQYFRKFESYQPHPSYPLVDATARGRSGPVTIGYFNTITEASKTFVHACVGVGIKLTHDFNGKDGTMGVGRVMTYVDKWYKRVSAESAYLTPEVLERKNLTVGIHATATRILFDTTSGSRPRAVGVEFGSQEGGQTWKAYAKKEVVVSGGAVHSPHILMLSGLGPTEHLKSQGIKPVLDLPGVGQRLVDHPVIDLYFKDRLNASPKFLRPQSLNEVRQALGAVIQYYVLGLGGPLAMNVFRRMCCFRTLGRPGLVPGNGVPDKLVDSTSAADSPDLEIFSTPFAYKEHGQVSFDVHTFALHVYLLRYANEPRFCSFETPNPWIQPSVNPNYITTPEDLTKLVRGVKLCLRIAQTEPLASRLDPTFTRADLDHERHLNSDVELEALIRERVETVYHPASTCRMAPLAEGGVVDSSLRVYGVDGLRVCDASVFPWIVSGHTAGACFAIAEKLADVIKAEFKSA